jgi:hypothetical protein
LRGNSNFHLTRETGQGTTRKYTIMTHTRYATTGWHCAHTELTTNRAVFTEAYAVLRATMRDIVTNRQAAPSIGQKTVSCSTGSRVPPIRPARWMRCSMAAPS